ncbi:hypothetical protein BMS3Abin13_00022 [bacterium BMS3Abin13]|nr:hypothetical protein BMS3Abin13_00022 [bacterium BMS3Abin13]
MTQHDPWPARPRHERYWQAHVTALKKSGLSRAEYCRQHELSYHALTYWHRKLSRRSRTGTTLVPVALEQISARTEHSRGAGLKILVNDRIAIEVDDNFSLTTLGRVLSVLEAR